MDVRWMLNENFQGRLSAGRSLTARFRRRIRCTRRVTRKTESRKHQGTSTGTLIRSFDRSFDAPSATWIGLAATGPALRDRTDAGACFLRIHPNFDLCARSVVPRSEQRRVDIRGRSVAGDAVD
jgi:hypothetical protein